LSKVELRIRHSIVYNETSFSVDREKGKLLSRQLAQVGIDADIFSREPIPIQGRKELSKEELRQKYIYPSSVKRLTGLEESLLIDEDIREFEEKVARQIKAATKPNLDFLTPAQRERLEELLKGKVI
jgi:hypothetical protein